MGLRPSGSGRWCRHRQADAIVRARNPGLCIKPFGTSNAPSAGVACGRMRRLGIAWLGVCICLLGLAGAASGRIHAKRDPRVRVSLHWPNSPVRHLKRLRENTNTTPSFSANLRGGVAFAGNTMETCPENVSAHKHRAKKQRHSRKRSLDSEACINANNNDHNMVYVNVDPSGGHFDSSSATLTVPTGARVVKAFLYWAADLSEGVNRPTVNPPSDGAPANGKVPADDDHPLGNTLWRTADLRVGSGSFTSIDATDPTREGVWKGIASWYNQPGQDPGFAYQVRADVTNEVNAGLSVTKKRTRSGADKQSHDDRRQRAGREGLQPVRRLEPARGVADPDGGVPRHHNLRRLRFRAGAGWPAARRRPAELHRLQHSGQRQGRRARDDLDHRGRSRDHRRLPGAGCGQRHV